MIQFVFALFAEDVKLLLNRLVSEILDKAKDNPARARQYLSMLLPKEPTNLTLREGQASANRP